MSDAKWTYLDGEEQQHGPFSRQELIALATEGTIDGNTFVQRADMMHWLRFANVSELRAARPPNASDVNVLANITASRRAITARARPLKSKYHGFRKYAVVAVAILGVMVADSIFGFLPDLARPSGSGGFSPAPLPSRWVSEDGREGASIHCKFERQAVSLNDKRGFRITADVRAGAIQNGVLPSTGHGNSRVVIRDASGREVFNRLVPNRDLVCYLAPS